MSDKPEPENTVALSRRNFLQSGAMATGASAFGGLAPRVVYADDVTDVLDQPEAPISEDALHKIELLINGRRRTLAVETRTTLVEALRDTLGMTGTKIGCNHGQCGACTVLLDGRRVNSCLILAVAANNGEVLTVEGLADPLGNLHPMQAAFAEHDAFQCGYCTPGQLLSAIACVEEGHAGSTEQIREYMSGNLCRCGAYPNIVTAIEAVRDSTVEG